MTTAALSSSLQAGLLQQRKCFGVGSRTRVVSVYARKGASGKQRGPMGYVAEDNSGKANIFAVEPKYVYTSSPRADKAARQGLGGQQGLLVVGGVLVVVALVTVGQGLFPAETLQQVAGPGEPLSTIAARLGATL